MHGQSPQLVGPGIISTDDRNETFPALDPVDGSLWFSVYTDNFNRQRIMGAERADDGWAAPEVAPFSGRWGDRAPRFSLDGPRLSFTSTRPLPGGEVQGRFHIWQGDRGQDGGWGPPRPATGGDPGADDLHGSVAASGAMYIASTRRGGLGSFDLYRIAG